MSFQGTREVKVKPLTKENFKRYGTIIDAPETKPTLSDETFDYWDGLVRINIENPQISFLKVKRQEFVLKEIERHTKIDEIFIPLEGVSVFPLGPPKDVENPNAEVPLDELEAFLLDGSKGVVIKKGVWHWGPYPITETATFVVILATDTLEKDLDIREIKPPIRIRF